MQNRMLVSLLGMFALAACGGYADESADVSAAPELSADEVALAERSEYWVTHYNMGHPGMVADLYGPDAWFRGANGGLASGVEEIAEALGQNAGASPQLESTLGGQMVFGDHAIAWGTYTMALSPEGAEAVSYGGTYMTHSSKIDGEWKIVGHLSNLTDDPFDDFEFTSPEGEPDPNEGTMGDFIDSYELHFNLGHPSMVADLYTEDAMASFTRGGPIMGRPAISAALTDLMEATPSKLQVNDLMTIDLGDGWALDGGWFAQSLEEGGDPFQVGGYLDLLKQADDGTWQLHWMVTNAWPSDGS